MSEPESDKAQQIFLKYRRRSTAKKYPVPYAIFGLYVFAAGDVMAAEEVSLRDDNYQPDTIVVTGEKVARTLYDTSGSVEVFDDARINAMPGASQVSDLLKMTANIVDTADRQRSAYDSRYRRLRPGKRGECFPEWHPAAVESFAGRAFPDLQRAGVWAAILVGYGAG